MQLDSLPFSSLDIFTSGSDNVLVIDARCHRFAVVCNAPRKLTSQVQTALTFVCKRVATLRRLAPPNTLTSPTRVFPDSRSCWCECKQRNGRRFRRRAVLRQRLLVRPWEMRVHVDQIEPLPCPLQWWPGIRDGRAWRVARMLSLEGGGGWKQLPVLWFSNAEFFCKTMWMNTIEQGSPTFM